MNKFLPRQVGHNTFQVRRQERYEDQLSAWFKFVMSYKGASSLAARLIFDPLSRLYGKYLQRRTIRMLGTLDDHILKDIGVSRGEIMGLATTLAHGAVFQDENNRGRRSASQLGSAFDDNNFAKTAEILRPHGARKDALSVHHQTKACC